MPSLLLISLGTGAVPEFLDHHPTHRSGRVKIGYIDAAARDHPKAPFVVAERDRIVALGHEVVDIRMTGSTAASIDAALQGVDALYVAGGGHATGSDRSPDAAALPFGRARVLARGMKLIGVLGGMSWESTAEYFRLLNTGVRDRLGGLHSARLRVATADFAAIASMQAAGDWPAAGAMLAQEARDLEAAGAAVILIATNTMHKVYDAVAAAVSVPVLHLGDITAEAVTAAGLTRVGCWRRRTRWSSPLPGPPGRSRSPDHGPR